MKNNNKEFLRIPGTDLGLIRLSSIDVVSEMRCSDDRWFFTFGGIAAEGKFVVADKDEDTISRIRRMLVGALTGQEDFQDDTTELRAKLDEAIGLVRGVVDLYPWGDSISHHFLACEFCNVPAQVAPIDTKNSTEHKPNCLWDACKRFISAQTPDSRKDGD